MNKTTMMGFLTLLFLFACSTQQQGDTSSGAENDPTQAKIAQRIMEAIYWYEQRPEDTYLDVDWDEREQPWMVGKVAFLKWLRSSDFFTEAFEQRIQHYLDQQEIDAREYPDLDHFVCQEQDLMIGFLEDKCTSVDSLEIEEGDDMLMVTFRVQCVSSIASATESRSTHRLKYRLVPVDSTWQIDQTGSIDAKGNWEKHWIL